MGKNQMKGHNKKMKMNRLKAMKAKEDKYLLSILKTNCLNMLMSLFLKISKLEIYSSLKMNKMKNLIKIIRVNKTEML